MNRIKPLHVFIVALVFVAGCKSTNKLTTSGYSSLPGTWELNFISGSRIAFDGLYPGKKPQLVFEANNKERISGNTGCNSFTGKMLLEGNTLSFQEPFAMTKMFCPGSGEEAFINMLKKVNKYSVSNNTLNLLIDDVGVMRFSKKE